jgi:hypothetical protein
MQTTSPTSSFYRSFENAYDIFNTELFNNELPPVLFTVTRKNNVMGYFMQNRWVSSENKLCSEIAVNPTFIGRSPLVEFFQTLAHEMCHCWQHSKGTPSRTGYHNREWSDKMKMIGLIPSTTGGPGGKDVGQKMNDYYDPNGKFIRVCMKLINDTFKIPWLDRHSKPANHYASLGEDFQGITLSDQPGDGPDSIQEIAALQKLTEVANNLLPIEAFEVASLAKKKTKLKYMCPTCKVSVWGKASLNLRCDDCDQPMEAVGD